MGLAHIMVFVFLFLLSIHSDNRAFAWAAMVCIYSFSMSFAATWGPSMYKNIQQIEGLRVRWRW